MNNTKLSISPARRHFKRRIGQVNHFLITTLVGLDGVKKENFTIPKEFSTSWNPRSIERSVERSVRFVLDASLSWVVDNLDSYFIECSRKPSIIENQQLMEAYTRTGRSVSNRFELFYNETVTKKEDVKKYAALVALAIQWRNNIVHFGAENDLDNKYEVILRQNKDLYINDFRHLNIDAMLQSFNSKNGHPTFKEVTSMIHAIHKYVECVDEFLLNTVDIERFKKDLYEKHFETFKGRKREVLNYSERRQKVFFETLLRQYGFQLEIMT